MYKRQAVLSRTEMLNQQLEAPMGYNEYKHIAKSIAKWTHGKFSKQGFAEWQSNNGKRSGIARRKGSAAELKPWVEQNISRATYYRRKSQETF